jgi:hypothetical protein
MSILKRMPSFHAGTLSPSAPSVRRFGSRQWGPSLSVATPTPPIRGSYSVLSSNSKERDP